MLIKLTREDVMYFYQKTGGLIRANAASAVALKKLKHCDPVTDESQCTTSLENEDKEMKCQHFKAWIEGEDIDDSEFNTVTRCVSLLLLL